MTSTRLAFFVILGAALLFIYRVDDPPASYERAGNRPMYVYDECYQAFTAERYALGDRTAWEPNTTQRQAASFTTQDMTRFTAYDWVHPPTAKLIMAGFIELFGFHAIAFRLGSVLFGILTLAMTWLLASRLRGPRFALVVVALLACDGMIFTLSRLAMNDIYVTGCMITAIYFLYRYWTAEGSENRWLFATGVMLGVSVSMKWSAVPLLIISAVVVAARIVGHRRHSGRALWSTLGIWFLALVALPACLYVASYIPFFAEGRGLADLGRLQHAMWTYHQTLDVGHSQASAWWQWPWITRPEWWFRHESSDGSRVIYAMGNPLLWWAFVPALAWVCVRLIRHRQLSDAVILFGFFALWLPWVFVRRVTFGHYLLPAVPFGALAIATVLGDLARVWRRGGRFIEVGYVAACFALLINFYPFWSAGLVGRSQLEGRRWFWFEKWREGSGFEHGP